MGNEQQIGQRHDRKRDPKQNRDQKERAREFGPQSGREQQQGERDRQNPNRTPGERDQEFGPDESEDRGRSGR